MAIDPSVRIEHRIAALSAPAAHYADAVSYGGLYYISGVLPVDNGGALFGGDDITAQAEQVFRNIGTTLDQVGCSFANVLKMTVFVTSIGDRAKIDAVRRAVFGATKPASTLVEIAALAVPGAKIEIEVTAALPDWGTMMMAIGREQYVEVTTARIKTEILDICTTCGKCATACPMTAPAGLDAADPKALVAGVLAMLGGEEGAPDSARWVEACSSSGVCVPACDYGVDPMFMMEMGRAAMLRQRGAKQVQSDATRAFQGMAKSVRYMSRLFLKPEVFERLDPRAGRPSEGEPSEVIFYTGCNVLRTPHIALICLDILDLLEIRYEVMGGPSHCCGSYQMLKGDVGAATGMAMNTIAKMVSAAAPEVISWCPSCKLQFSSTHLPTYAAVHGEMPFDFTAFYIYLEARIEALAPFMKNPVNRRVALDERAFDPQVNAAVRRILGLIPGLELVELEVEHVGMMRNMIPLEGVKKLTRDAAFEAATQAGVETLATVYHACHREIVSYSATVSFEIVNAIELIADSLGIAYHDSFKEFQMVQDLDQYIDERAEQIAHHRLSIDEARTVARNEFTAHRPA
ncbi:Rid family hydrolase [Xanthobacter sp. KR7-65]|uniref:Rid family hydrolase n=1 Tax=Xanthobacter sp. KR7-65 TaxID=3156612 RepID=UPI0032B57B87